MLKKLWPCARPYLGVILMGVFCSGAEAVFELLIPLVMSDIVDIGIAAGDVDYILKKGFLMVGLALVSLGLYRAGRPALLAAAGSEEPAGGKPPGLRCPGRRRSAGSQAGGFPHSRPGYGTT